MWTALQSNGQEYLPHGPQREGILHETVQPDLCVFKSSWNMRSLVARIKGRFGSEENHRGPSNWRSQFMATIELRTQDVRSRFQTRFQSPTFEEGFANRVGGLRESFTSI